VPSACGMKTQWVFKRMNAKRWVAKISDDSQNGSPLDFQASELAYADRQARSGEWKNITNP